MKKYYSQIGQDQYYIENISKEKKHGIYLDVGSNNGIFESNTAALEFDYNRSGIGIEANPKLIDELTKSRPNSKIVNCAVWSSNGEIEIEIPTWGAYLDHLKGDRKTAGRSKDKDLKVKRTEAYWN